MGDLPSELAVGSPALRRLWTEGEALETAGRLRESIDRYQQAVADLPDQGYPHWRIARNYWRMGENLPLEDREGRIFYFELAEAAARRGLEVQEDCAGCMLWRAAALGRLATTRGMVSAAQEAPVIAGLLERGIALAPSHRDGDTNTTLGNLYHAAAAFYRLVPDWFWLEWMIGVRGDKQRSVEYSRQAVAISSMRVDYQVELGAGLLCLGATRGSEESLREGRQVLQHSMQLERILPTDARDLAYARLMLKDPDCACGYARDGFVDFEASLAAAP
jgi:hypothetical protein